MGIDIETARFLLTSKQSGVSFDRCATVGRQNYFLGRRETLHLLRDFGIAPQSCPELLSDNSQRFSEPFWHLLGARELVTIDASNYEGASRVHDMNQPVPDDLKERFDAVCDIGTLEHVFNFPVAIRNCLEMVKPGGYFLAQTPANNYLGHGFYQFSPELFFRILSPRNGFQVESMVAIEYGLRRRWFEVADPETIRARVTLINRFPVLLLLRARKTATVPLLVQPPQQSDYFAQWNSTAGGSSPAKTTAPRPNRSLRERVARAFLETTPGLARFAEAFAFTFLTRRFSFRNRQSFSRVRNRR